jgi:clan AA aspartic protease (TIGR02281 family)
MFKQRRPNRTLLVLLAGALLLFAAPVLAQSRLPSCLQAQTYWHMCFGTFTFPSGDRYVGEWRDNKFDGEGTYTLPSGERYVGEFRSHQRNGQGTHILPSGEKYVGEFKNGKRDGQGSLFNARGTLLQRGAWRNNAFVQTSNQPNSTITAQGSSASVPPRTGIGSATSVRLIRESGTFKVPVRINGVLELHFTVDSGASDVTIPADVARTLFRTGTISESDFIGEQTYRLADGSTVRSRTFRIRQLEVGGRTVTNVLGSIGGVESSLLLGQSFLSRFQRVSFDYGQGVLILE